MFRLPDGTIVNGGWVEIDGAQYMLDQLSDAELAALGVERLDPPPPPPQPPSYNPTLDMGGSIRNTITGS